MNLNRSARHRMKSMDHSSKNKVFLLEDHGRSKYTKNLNVLDISQEESKHLETDTSNDVKNESKIISIKELNPTSNLASSQQLSSKYQTNYEDFKRIEHEMTLKYGNKRQLMKNLLNLSSKNQTMKSAGVRFKATDKLKEYDKKWKEPFSSVLSIDTATVEKEHNNSSYIDLKFHPEITKQKESESDVSQELELQLESINQTHRKCLNCQILENRVQEAISDYERRLAEIVSKHQMEIYK